MIRRSWQGLRVALVDTPAGTTSVGASEDHRLGLHVGRPVHATCRFGGRTQRRVQTRGDMDLVPAGEPGVWQDDRATRILLVELSRALVESTGAHVGLDPARIDLAPQFQLRDARIGHILGALQAELEADAPSDPLYGESLAIALASQLVLRFSALRRRPIASKRALHPRVLKRVTEFIDANLDRALSIAELATVVALSPSHFKALFKQSTRLSVHAYVVRQRVERAQRLLESDLPLAEIATRTGFTDQSHMARWVRRELGTTPGALRRRRA
jgi:AraC family transcriptional regulator